MSREKRLTKVEYLGYQYIIKSPSPQNAVRKAMRHWIKNCLLYTSDAADE